MYRHLALLVVIACGPGVDPIGASDSGSTAITSTADGDTAVGTSSTTGVGTPSTTGVTEDACPCYPPESRCDNGVNLDMCEAPEPCGLLSEDAAAATTCILGLLRERALARFNYQWKPAGTSYFGEFYVLGGDDGIDFECQTSGLTADLNPRAFKIETPEYFASCLDLVEQKDRLGCLIAGLHSGETFPACSD